MAKKLYEVLKGATNDLGRVRYPNGAPIRGSYREKAYMFQISGATSNSDEEGVIVYLSKAEWEKLNAKNDDASEASGN